MEQNVSGNANFNMPVSFTIDVPEPIPPIEKPFTISDAAVQQLIPKGHLPKGIILWAKTTTGYSFQGAVPVSIFELEEDLENDLLIFNNENQIAGTLIITL